MTDCFKVPFITKLSQPMFLRFKDTGHTVLSEEQTHFLHLHRNIIENLKSMAAIVAEIVCLSMLCGGFVGPVVLLHGNAYSFCSSSGPATHGSVNVKALSLQNESYHCLTEVIPEGQYAQCHIPNKLNELPRTALENRPTLIQSCLGCEIASFCYH